MLNAAAYCRYGVPGTSARRFEEVMRTTAPQRFEEDRDLLHHLTTLTPPPLLMNNGKSNSSPDNAMGAPKSQHAQPPGARDNYMQMLTACSTLQESKWYTLYSTRVSSSSLSPRHITVDSA